MPGRSVLESPELALARIDARAGGENFPVASFLAPREARPHLRAVYGFARLVDTLGDEAEGDRDALLDALEQELDGPPTVPVMRRLHATIAACGLPREPFARLIEANRRDQRTTRYETWDDVREYCSYSAEPVGRIVLGIYGRADEPELVAASDDVCTGLQLVNFLQDPPRDLALGRVYLPQEDLRRHGCTEEDLRREAQDAGGGIRSNAVKALLAGQAARAREFYARAARELPREDARRLAAAEIMGAIYRGILDRIEAAEYDVFSRVVRIPRPERARIAAFTWARMLAGWPAR
jgi:squalene synthase HpnC